MPHVLEQKTIRVLLKILPELWKECEETQRLYGEAEKGIMSLSQEVGEYEKIMDFSKQRKQEIEEKGEKLNAEVQGNLPLRYTKTTKK